MKLSNISVVFGLILTIAGLAAGEPASSIRPIEPRDGQVLSDFLTAKLRWEIVTDPAASTSTSSGKPDSVWLTVIEASETPRTIVDTRLPAGQTEFRLVVRPQTKYVWRVAPIYGEALASGCVWSVYVGPAAKRTGGGGSRPLSESAPGAHYQQMTPVPVGQSEPLSPWYAVKKYAKGPPPTFRADSRSVAAAGLGRPCRCDRRLLVLLEDALRGVVVRAEHGGSPGGGELDRHPLVGAVGQHDGLRYGLYHLFRPLRPWRLFVYRRFRQLLRTAARERIYLPRIGPGKPRSVRDLPGEPTFVCLGGMGELPHFRRTRGGWPRCCRRSSSIMSGG